MPGTTTAYISQPDYLGKTSQEHTEFFFCGGRADPEVINNLFGY